MSSTDITSMDIRHFHYFTSLPPEIRFVIWRLSLQPRTVELFWSERSAGFYSNAALPSALQVCWESRRAVEALYPRCFGSFLLPERTRFNFDLDTLYLDSCQEEDGFPHFLGVAKETELRCLKYLAIDHDFPVDQRLKRAVKAMTGLLGITVVLDVTTDAGYGYWQETRSQMQLYDNIHMGEDEGRLRNHFKRHPDVSRHLPGHHSKYAELELASDLRMVSVYGLRAWSI